MSQERYLAQKSPAARLQTERAFIDHLKKHRLDVSNGGTSTIMDSGRGEGNLQPCENAHQKHQFLYCQYFILFQMSCTPWQRTMGNRSSKSCKMLGTVPLDFKKRAFSSTQSHGNSTKEIHNHNTLINRSNQFQATFKLDS